MILIGILLISSYLSFFHYRLSPISVIILENVYSKRASIGYWFLNHWNYLHHMWMSCSNQWSKYQNISKIYAFLQKATKICAILRKIFVAFSKKLNFNDVGNFQFNPQGNPYCYHGNVCSEISGLGNFTGMVMIVSGIVFVLSSRNLSNKQL